ncbi:MAG: hypothetical protein ISS67_02780 [Desulfobacterales bacterium]|uniref:Uncharacterized protein n=1 Tax=Candidatus Desulfaltia bathyphila TaxID=2841697 RepID=A0A8J6N4A7_9BACT|nr:hypothetical protein [Candidatus Desulfaltia bathyphila]MBL7196014.1 hypothetical protein [Desulfobacterales bacterium]MBL7207436.1 hypothetical protein [Desulfobacterales bacterium]
MEDLSRNLAKIVKAHTPPKSSKPSKKAGSWSILFLGDHGQIISIKRPKKLVITLAVVLVVAIVSFSWLLIVFKSTREDNKNLSSALDISRQKVMSLRDEKDLLMVRLVVAESKIKNKDADMSLDTDPSVETEADSEKVDKTASLPNKKQVEEKTAFTRSEKFKKTTVEDFIVLFEPDTAALKVEFKIVNTSQNAQPVSGHAFVILKQSEVDQKSWLTFPSVPLASGKPTLFKKGQHFSISRFKTMKFKTQNKVDPKQFKTATVFVFTTTGELLLEKSFPVEIKETVSSQT